jgi:hypothetical protein
MNILKDLFYSKSDSGQNDHIKKLDFAKLNYFTMNFTRNQQLQYYFSMEIPELLNVSGLKINYY